MTPTSAVRAAHAPPPGGRSHDERTSDDAGGFANALAGEGRRAPVPGTVAPPAAGTGGSRHGATDQTGGDGAGAHAGSPPLEGSPQDVPSQVVPSVARLRATASSGPDAGEALAGDRSATAGAKGDGGVALVTAAAANRPAVGVARSTPGADAVAGAVIAPKSKNQADGPIQPRRVPTVPTASASPTSTLADPPDRAGSSATVAGRLGRISDADGRRVEGSITDTATRGQGLITATDATALRVRSRAFAPTDPGTRLVTSIGDPIPQTAFAAPLTAGVGEAARDAIARHALSSSVASVAWSPSAAMPEGIAAPGGLPTAPHGVAPQAPAAAMRLVVDLAPAPPSAPVVLRLHPAELGAMEVEIARRAGGLAIELRVDTPESLRALEAERGALEGTLRREGEGGASVSISLRERSGDEAKEDQRATLHTVADEDTTDAPAAVVHSVSRTI